MPSLVKICGVSTMATLDAAIAGGSSHVGLNFVAASPRYVTAEQAAALVARAGGRVKIVGLFVDAEPGFMDAVRRDARLDVVQLHGSETPTDAAAIGGEVWKAISVRTAADLASAARYRGAMSRILYDAKPPEGAPLTGGTGLRFDWALLDGFAHPIPWGLAGGLDAGNVADAIRRTRAPLVDVSSGVESAPGVKDVDKIAAFLQAARS